MLRTTTRRGVLLIGVLYGTPLYAIDFTWVGAPNHSGPWSNAAFWSPPIGPPDGAGDRATIRVDDGSSYTVLLDIDATLLEFTLDDSNASLLVPLGQNRSLSIVSGGSLNLPRGELAGNLSFAVESATIALGSTSSLSGSATFEISGTGNMLTADDDELGSGQQIVVRAQSGGSDLEIATTSGQFSADPGTNLRLVPVLDEDPVASVDGGLGEYRNLGIVNAGGMAESGEPQLRFQLRNEGTGRVDLNTDAVVGTEGGTQRHVNLGRIEFHGNTLTALGTSFANAAGGIMAGGGTLDVSSSRFLNFGRLSPAIDFVGDIENSLGAFLEIGIGGTSPGTGNLPGEFDQVVASGEVVLAGTLDLALTNDFSPALSDEFNVISAAAISGDFDRIVPLPLPSDRGMKLETTPDGLTLRIKTPASQTFISTEPASLFVDASAWDANGASPDTDWDAVIANVSGSDQQLRADSDQTLQGMTISGGPGESAGMEVRVEESVFVGLSDSAHVAPGGSLILEGSGSVVDATTIELAGGTLDGVGIVDADVENAGIIRPGLPVGQLSVIGDYSEDPAAVFEVDVGGTEAGTEHDQISVLGTAVLEGTLILDFVALTRGTAYQPMPGDEFTILVADMVQGQWESIEIRNSHVEAHTDYRKDQAIVVIDPFRGDFDRDGDVDGDDFLTWQANFGCMQGCTAMDGDADRDGDVDGDDFLAWQAEFGLGVETPMNSDAVPEMATCYLLAAIGSLLTPRRSAFHCRSKSRSLAARQMRTVPFR